MSKTGNYLVKNGINETEVDALSEPVRKRICEWHLTARNFERQNGSPLARADARQLGISLPERC